MVHSCGVPEVDPDDDDALRYVVYHYRYDCERHERRMMFVAAYDNESEFTASIEALGDALRSRAARGEGDPRESVSARCSHLGTAARPKSSGGTLVGSSAGTAAVHETSTMPRASPGARIAA